MLFDYGAKHDDSSMIEQLVVVRNGQHVFREVITDYLQRIEYDSDGYARLNRVPGYGSDVVCGPTRSFGRPIFARGGAQVADVLGRFQAGESLTDLATTSGYQPPTWKTLYALHPAGLPDLLLDRSLGRVKVRGAQRGPRPVGTLHGIGR